MLLSFEHENPVRPARIVGIFVVILVLAIIAQGIYRLFLHPYSKYPGPLLARLSDWYGAYHAAIGDLHIDIWQCHQKYGNIIRYGPDRIIVDSSTGLHDIYDHGKKVIKSKSYSPIAHATGGPNLLATVDKSRYRRKRRLLSQGFSTDALKAFEPKMLTLLEVFCDNLVTSDRAVEQQWTKPRNMRDWCSWLTFDIIGEFGYGVELNTMKSQEYRFMIDVVLALDARNGIYAQSPSLPGQILDIVWSPLKRKHLMQSLKWRAEMKDKVLGKEKASSTLFSNLLEAKDPETGQGLSMQELMAEAQFLLVAGFETTATTLSSLFFYLANYPSVYKKLAHEIRTSFAHPSEIQTGAQLQSCTYLWACIQEATRMSPAGVGVMWREAAPGGLVVDGEFVAGGYDIGTSIYAIHHNEDYFPNSFAFIPERWIPGSGIEPSEDARRAFNPFSLGPRTCIGRPLAMMEVSVTIALVLYQMDFRAAGEECGPSGRGIPGAKDGRDHVGEYQLYSHLTSYSVGPMLQFRTADACAS